MSHAPIPVICDRCRVQGTAGAENFTDVGDLLDFQPVPRRLRADGWTPELQRAFIAALAVTGSPRRAAHVVGKAQFGAEQLRKAKGAASFNAAWDKAMALAAEKGRQRLNTSLGTALGLPQPPAGPTPEEMTADEYRKREACLDSILRKYVLKLTAERQARLAGKIVEADFYARQLTHIEVSVDLMSGDGFRAFMDFRHNGRDLTDIAETPLSRLLDDTRRAFWERTGQAAGPRETARDLLIDLGVISVPRSEAIHGGSDMTPEEQEQAYRERHAADAAEQVEWEAEAAKDAATWRERIAREGDGTAQVPPRNGESGVGLPPADQDRSGGAIDPTLDRAQHGGGAAPA